LPGGWNWRNAPGGSRREVDHRTETDMNDQQQEQRPEPGSEDHRERARQGTSLSWVHRFRVTPLALVIFFVVLGVAWYVLESTGLWLVLFP